MLYHVSLLHSLPPSTAQAREVFEPPNDNEGDEISHNVVNDVKILNVLSHVVGVLGSAVC